MCWGPRGYSFAAYNLALSIKEYSGLPIVLFTDGLKQVPDQSVFDWQEPLSESDLTNPAEVKTRMYENLPFDYNLFLDVDALALKDLNGIFDECIKKGGDYYTYIYDWYDHTSPDELPMMYWAYRSQIWKQYNFDESTRMPATQSSIQFMKKGDNVAKLGAQVRANLAEPIPLGELRNKWGGTQPDELYLNIALAQLGYGQEVHIGECIFFGYQREKTWTQVKEQYYILSLFGGRGHTKEPYLRGYDKQLEEIHKARGTRHTFDHSYIIGEKHANNRKQTKGMGLKRIQRAQQQIAMRGGSPGLDYSQGPGQITLWTNYYNPGKNKDQRHVEILTAIKRNIENKDIDLVGIFTEVPLPKELESYKTFEVRIKGRPTYGEMINTINANSGTRNEDEKYNILVNSDIYTDHSVNLLYHSDLQETVFCVSRYDMRPQGPVLFNYDYSQDAWAWKGKLVVDGVDFPQGKPGCDNVFAFRLTACGYKVANPAVDFKTYHLHQSNYRTYGERDRLDPPYRNIKVHPIGPYLKKKLLLRQNGKVGDILICAPIAKYYSGAYEVIWEAQDKYHDLIKKLGYATPIAKANRGTFDKVIDLNFGLETHNPVHKEWLKRQKELNSFVELKYEMAEVPLEERWKFKYKRTVEDMERGAQLRDHLHKPGTGDYAVIHDQSHYGDPAEIRTSLPTVRFRPHQGYSILDWRATLEGAAEIHCIDSSLCNFVEVLELKAKLFYYPTNKCPHKWDETLISDKWTRVNTKTLQAATH